MKTKFVFLVLPLIIFASCKEESYKEIRKAFRQYVTENFGNPKDMKEITLIELKDTVNISELRTPIIEALEADSTLIVKQDSILHWMMNNDEQFKKVVFWFENEFLDEMGQMCDYEKRKKHLRVRENIKNKIEESYNAPNYYIHYLIKARISDGERNNVKEFHAYKDSKGKLYIKDREMEISEVDGTWTDLMNEMQKLMQISNKEIESVKNVQRMIKRVFG